MGVRVAALVQVVLILIQTIVLSNAVTLGVLILVLVVLIPLQLTIAAPIPKKLIVLVVLTLLTSFVAAMVVPMVLPKSTLSLPSQLMVPCHLYLLWGR